MEDRMTSKLVVNTIESDTGISSVSFASSISMSSTSKFFFGAAGIDIGADLNINRPASGILGFNINNSEKVRISSSGGVGIATNSLTGNALTLGATGSIGAALVCQNPTTSYGSNQGFYFGNGNGTVGYVWNYENDSMRFATNNTEALRIDAAGNMSLGKSAASSTNYGTNFQIHDSGTSGATLHLTTSQTGSSNGDGFHLVQQGPHIYHWNREAGDQVFATGGIEKLRITSAGHISQGGLTAPATTNGNIGRKFGIKSTANNIIIGETTQSGANYGLHIESRQTGRSGNARFAQMGLQNNSSGAGEIKFFTAASGADITERVAIQGGGLKLNGGSYIMEVFAGHGAPNNNNKVMDQRRWMWYGASSQTHTVARVAKASSGSPGDGDSMLAAFIVTYTARSMYSFNSGGGYSVMKMRTGRINYNNDNVHFSTEQDTLGTGSGSQNPTIVFTDEGSGVVRISITNPGSTHSFGEINLMTYDCRITLPSG